MKLLLDENLSHRLLAELAWLYPGSSQVAVVGLSGANDEAVWQYAKAEGYTPVTKDDDFLHLAAHRGPPPVVVRLSLGNCKNTRVREALVASAADIHAAVASGQVGLIELN